MTIRKIFPHLPSVLFFLTLGIGVYFLIFDKGLLHILSTIYLTALVVIDLIYRLFRPVELPPDIVVDSEYDNKYSLGYVMNLTGADLVFVIAESILIYVLISDIMRTSPVVSYLTKQYLALVGVLLIVYVLSIRYYYNHLFDSDK